MDAVWRNLRTVLHMESNDPTYDELRSGLIVDLKASGLTGDELADAVLVAGDLLTRHQLAGRLAELERGEYEVFDPFNCEDLFGADAASDA